MTNLIQITIDWEAITEWLDASYVAGIAPHNPNASSDTQLGKAFREYVLESDHAGWEGFNSRDRTTIRRFLLDFMAYEKNMK